MCEEMGWLIIISSSIAAVFACIRELARSLRDPINSARSRGHRTRPPKVRLALAKLMLVIVLLFGKRLSSVTAADVVRWPRPCWIRQAQWVPCQPEQLRRGTGSAESDTAFESRSAELRVALKGHRAESDGGLAAS